MKMITNLLLPLSLFAIMLSIGLSVPWRAFGQVVVVKKALVLGVFLQMVGLPLLALLLIHLFDLKMDYAVALMIIACCPGGATSNGITFLFSGVVTLSIALTLISSLLMPITTPLITQWSLNYFLADSTDYQFPLLKTVVQLLVLSVVPIVLGNLLRLLMPLKIQVLERQIKRYVGIFFIGVLLLLIFINYRLLANIVSQLGAYLLLMAVLALTMGFWGAKAFGLAPAYRLTLAIEVGLQNAGVGMIVTGVVLNNPTMTMILVTYGILMQIPVLLFAWFYNKSGKVN